MGSNAVGEVAVLVTGDYSQLQTDLKQAEGLAAQGATEIAGAFNGARGGVMDLDEAIKLLTADGLQFDDSVKSGAQSINSFSEAARQAVEAANQSAEATTQAATGADNLASQLEKAGLAATPLSDELKHTGEGAHEAAGGMGEMAEKLVALGEALAITEALREFGTEALSAFDSVQKATNSLTALTGSAEKAGEVLEGVEKIAATQPFSFPELAASAQKMAAFGFDAAKIPEILTDVANVSRATGNSFDGVAAAIERVSLQGQVSGRQLIQLGISWEDLAKTAGRSVADTQELLKKGGQSAAADLDLLLKTVETKFSSFAQVPLSIGEQWKVLQNTIHAAFAELGAALAPIATQIVDFLKNDIVPAVKTLVEMFNALPGPVKDGAVAFGLVLAALAPLSLAAGALGLGLSAIRSAAVMASEGLAALGISAGSAATAEEAAAVAAGHLATAEAGVSAAAGTAGMAAAIGTAGFALVTFGGAIAATMANLNDLKGKWDEVVAEFKSKQIVDAINSGVTLETLKKIGVSVDNVKTAIEAHGHAIGPARVEMDLFGNSALVTGTKTKEMAEQVKDATEKFDEFGYKVKIVKDSLPGVGFAAQAVIDKQKELNEAVKTAQQAVDDLTAAQKRHEPVAQALARAQSDLAKAHEAATTAVKGNVLSLSDLTAKEHTLDEEARQSISVWTQVRTAYEHGTASAGLLAAAHDQMLKSLKAAKEGFSDLSITVINSFRDQAAAFEAFRQGYGAGALDLIQKQKDLQKAANDAATTFNQLAANALTDANAYNTLQTAIKNVEDKLKAAGMAGDDLDVKLKRVGNEGIPVITGGVTKIQDAFGRLDPVIKDVNDRISALGQTGGQSITVMNGGVVKSVDLFTSLGGAAKDTAASITTLGAGYASAFTILSTETVKASEGLRTLIGDTKSEGDAFAAWQSDISPAVPAINAVDAACKVLLGDTQAQGNAFAAWQAAVTPASASVTAVSGTVQILTGHVTETGSAMTQLVSTADQLPSALQASASAMESLAAATQSAAQSFAAFDAAREASSGSQGAEVAKLKTMDLQHPEQGGYTISTTGTVGPSGMPGYRFTYHEPYSITAPEPGKDLTKQFGPDWKNPGAMSSTPPSSSLSPTVSTPLGIDPTILSAASAAATAAINRIADNTANLLTVAQRILDAMGQRTNSTTDTSDVPPDTKTFYTQQVSSTNQLISQSQTQGRAYEQASAMLGDTVSGSGLTVAKAVTSGTSDIFASVNSGLAGVVKSSNVNADQMIGQLVAQGLSYEQASSLVQIAIAESGSSVSATVAKSSADGFGGVNDALAGVHTSIGNQTTLAGTIADLASTTDASNAQIAANTNDFLAIGQQLLQSLASGPGTGAGVPADLSGILSLLSGGSGSTNIPSDTSANNALPPWLQNTTGIDLATAERNIEEMVNGTLTDNGTRFTREQIAAYAALFGGVSSLTTATNTLGDSSNRTSQGLGALNGSANTLGDAFSKLSGGLAWAAGFLEQRGLSGQDAAQYVQQLAGAGKSVQDIVDMVQHAYVTGSAQSLPAASIGGGGAPGLMSLGDGMVTLNSAAQTAAEGLGWAAQFLEQIGLSARDAAQYIQQLVSAGKSVGDIVDMVQHATVTGPPRTLPAVGLADAGAALGPRQEQFTEGIGFIPQTQWTWEMLHPPSSTLPPDTWQPSPAPNSTSTTITINNPQVRNQSDIDALVMQLRDLGVT